MMINLCKLVMEEINKVWLVSSEASTHVVQTHTVMKENIPLIEHAHLPVRKCKQKKALNTPLNATGPNLSPGKVVDEEGFTLVTRKQDPKLAGQSRIL